MPKTDLERKWEEYSKRLLYACIINPTLLDTIDIIPSDLHPAVAPAFADIQRKRLQGIFDENYVLGHYSADELELMEPGDVQATLRVLKPLAARGRLAMALQEAYADIKRRPLEDLSATLQEAIKYALARGRDNGKAANPATGLQPLADEVMALVDALANGDRPYVPTTYKGVDRLIGGLWPGNFYVIAGRPGIGKTAFAVNLFHRLASVHNTLFVTYEMTPQELMMRLLSLISRVSYFHIRTGRVDNWERKQLDIARGKLPPYGELMEASGKPVEELVTAILEASRHHTKVVVVDYLQRIPYPRGVDMMDVAVGHICKSLKNVALKANVAVVVLAQLNRQVEQTSSRRPELHHLRESGNIEQEADLVGFLYREGYYKEGGWDAPETLEVIIRKNRHGPVGTAELVFYPQTMQITDKEEP